MRVRVKLLKLDLRGAGMARKAGKTNQAAGDQRAKAEPAANHALKVSLKEGDNPVLATAAAILAPGFRHGATAWQIHKPQFGKSECSPGVGDYGDIIAAAGDAARKGELKMASELMIAQALTLDSIFTEMARRMALNMGEYLGATETYARIAMKAQAQSRATLEALAKLHQPREQTVRHVHVNEGGQAVIADQFHNHAGGARNAATDDQSHGTATGAAGIGPALLSQDTSGNGVPIPSREGPEKVPNARRDEPGSA